MKTGLGNLITLRKFLLADSLAGESRFDAKITLIGLGVTGLIDQFCNRSFAYLEGDTATFDIARGHYYLPRYPFTTITKVEQRNVTSPGWYDLGDVSAVVINRDERTGWISFGWLRGIPTSLLRVTYSGGYWFETGDEGEDGYPGTAPDGAALLPDAVRLAWLLQCQEVWNKMDKLGGGLVDKPDAQSSLGTLELSPMVKTTLQQFVRFQIT